MMNKLAAILISIICLTGCQPVKTDNEDLQKKIRSNEYFGFVKNKALEVVQTGFNAGDGYGEVWIRDYNTFIELSAEVYESEVLKENLLVFFRMQGDDGNIIDGFIPKEKAGDVGYDYRYSELEPRYAGHKNTVETDQESSLVQAVYKYVKATGDRSILHVKVGEKTVAERLEWSMEFLMNHRYNKEYGLLWGATTADWGDVQPEHEWGVYLTEDTHYAIDIYDNAMFLIAIENYLKMIEEPPQKEYWEDVRAGIANRTIKHLWDANRKKFRPNVYLNEDPWPEWFDESRIYYTGSPALAIRAGVLDEEKANQVVRNMINTKKYAGAATLGIVNFPPYPSGFFKNNSLRPYNYQNAGDWSWWGGRIIQVLVKSGREQLAYRELLPMLKRVQKHDGFYEWYTVDNEPRGSGKFRGSAGALGKAIRRLRSWAKTVRSKKGK